MHELLPAAINNACCSKREHTAEKDTHNRTHLIRLAELGEEGAQVLGVLGHLAQALLVDAPGAVGQQGRHIPLHRLLQARLRQPGHTLHPSAAPGVGVIHQKQ